MCASAGLPEKPTNVVVSGGADTLTVTFDSVGLLTDYDTFIYRLYHISDTTDGPPVLVDTRIVPRATQGLFVAGDTKTAGSRLITISKAAEYGVQAAPSGG